MKSALIITLKGKYSIDENGVVINELTKKQIKPHDTGKGYMSVILGKKNYYVHRLVAQAFIPNPENKRTVNHKDGIKSNNNVHNLEWNTHRENINHYMLNAVNVKPFVANGNFRFSRRVLTEEQVRFIKYENKKKFKQYELAEMYGVDKTTISAVYLNKRWKHV